jgi:hypothetical protein
MKVMLIFLIVILSNSISSQTIDTWERRYGDEMKERGKQIVRMNDGTFLINANKIVDDYGFTNLIWLIAVDQNGDSLWTKVIGDSMLNRYINDISQSTTGDLFVASGYDQGGLGQTAFISKKTAGYEEIWTKTYTNLPSLGVGVSKVACMPDSGCVIIVSMQESFEGGSDSVDKIDKSGVVRNSYFPSYEMNDSTYYWPVAIPDILPLEDSGFLILVSKYINYEIVHHFVVKLDNDLTCLWEREYSQSDPGYLIKAIEPTADGNFIIIEEERIVKIDPEANVLWTSDLMNNLRDAKQSSDGAYFVAGYSNTYKIDDTGKLLWTKDFGSSSLVLTVDGGCMAVGTKFNDVWICKFDQDGNYVNINNYVGTIDGYELHQNYPNPFNPETTIKYTIIHDADVKIAVFDIAGKEVVSLVENKQGKGSHIVNFNAENLTSGIYFYKLSIDDKVVASKSMIFLK